MPDQPVSRRTVAIALAGGVVGAKLASNVWGPGSSPASADPSSASAASPGADAIAEAHALPLERRLLSPLTEGSKLLAWEVVTIEPLVMGAVKVQLRGESGAAFGVEVLARDSSPLALAPPGRTERFAVYVNNGGDGRSATAEEQGLAAMALAQIVARNEEHVATDGFMTQGERLAGHSLALLEHVDGSNFEGPHDHRTMLPTSGNAAAPATSRRARA